MKSNEETSNFNMTPIFVENFSKTYRGKKGSKVAAVKDISFSVKKGEVFGFLGPNGSGKSTTIKAIMGLIRPSLGQVFLNGLDAREAQARLSVGFLPENPALYDFLNAREYLQFVARVRAMNHHVEDRIKGVLSLLALEDAAGRPLKSYSKGMVQRLGLAQALLSDPEVVILDEPMSGLDPIGRALVKEIILDLKARGKTVFFSTHVTADVERVCDRIGVIVNGVFLEQRVVSELLREGIDGYFCRVRGLEPAKMQDLNGSDCGDGVCEVFVPRDRFDTFSADLLAHGGGFDLVEPRRRDVEKYFLDLVARSEGES